MLLFLLLSPQSYDVELFLSLERSYHFCFTSFCCHLSFCFSVVVVVVLFYSSYIHFDICCLEIDVVVVYVLQSSLLCFIVFILLLLFSEQLID